MERDIGDELRIFSLVEDPDRWEDLIRKEIELARSDTGARSVLQSIYCDEDRDAAFQRFRRSFEFSVLLKLLERLGIAKSLRICEIGGGGGWLSWALHQHGFRNIDLLEPNSHFISGTGYLRSREDAREIRIHNDLAAWYADPGRYDLILTHNCVHHFRGLAQAAAAIRQKITPLGRWLMTREWFADTPSELYQQMREHPYCQKYGVYEFPYPASYYVDSLEIAGFRLESVVPALYANNALAADVETNDGLMAQTATRFIDLALELAPDVTVRAYRMESLARRLFGWRRFHVFTRPQALMFRRVPLHLD